MIQFKDYITEGRSETNFLVDTVYSKYIEKYSKNQPECVGWLDGTENAQLRFQKVYEAGIGDNDSVLDVGCGVAHLHTYLTNQGWSGKYFGFFYITRQQDNKCSHLLSLFHVTGIANRSDFLSVLCSNDLVIFLF